MRGAAPTSSSPSPPREEVQLDFFDAEGAAIAKARGMATAAESRAEVLEVARTVAREIALARRDRTCDADDVAWALLELGLDGRLGPAAGSVFSGRSWEPAGFTTSARPRQHAALLRRWRLREEVSDG